MDVSFPEQQVHPEVPLEQLLQQLLQQEQQQGQCLNISEK